MRRQSVGSVLEEDIIRQITDGQLSPGDMLLSSAEAAAQYGISYATAHKVFQSLVRTGYCRRVAGQGTFVSDNPPKNEIRFVGIPSYSQMNPFHAHMIEEVTIQGSLRGIQTIVGRGVRTQDLLARMDKYGIRAMIRFPGASEAPKFSEAEVWQMLKDQNVRAVIVNDFWREGGPFPHVRTDEAAGVAEMTNHLIELGHRRILLVMETASGTRPDAVRAHQRAFEERGLPYKPEWVFNLYPSYHDSREDTIRQMLDMATAAIVMYDMYAVDLAVEFRRMGVVLGKDFSLAGFDGIPEAEAHGLSTVAQPVAEIASQAFALLTRSDARDIPKILIKPHCVFRESTGPAPSRRDAVESAFPDAQGRSPVAIGWGRMKGGAIRKQSAGERSVVL